MQNFTNEQLLAIHLSGADLIVSAAAGSGKTEVLVQRIIKMITDNEKPVDIDRLLVVTFTEQAAFEMKNRIISRLGDMQNEDPDDKNLSRQLSLVETANISTIHSFCLSIVKDYFFKIDLDPGFKIAEPSELAILKQDVLDDLLETEYEKNDSDFLTLVEVYGGKFMDLPLKNLITGVHSFVAAFPWPEKKLDEYVEMFNVDQSSAANESVWARVVVEAVKVELSGFSDELRSAEGICLLDGGPLKYAVNIRNEINSLDLIKGMQNFDEFYDAFKENIFLRLPSIKKDEPVNEDLKEDVKKIRDKTKVLFKAIGKKYFFKCPEAMIEDIFRLYQPIKKLAGLVARFDKMYSDAKREINVLDFNDLEHCCVAALLEYDNYSGVHLPTNAALEIKSRFDEILIDEYQDSNSLQEIILQTISEKNRFMVGDIKQSIYKFRQARPEILIEKYENASYYVDKPGTNGIKIDLNKNFRSRETVINGINKIFGQIMTKRAGDTEYGINSALHYGAEYPEAENMIDDSVEIIITEHKKNDLNDEFDNENDDSQYDEDEIDYEEPPDDAEYGGAELEAAIIAKRIRKLIYDEKYPVYDKTEKAYRPIRFGDIAVLSSSVKAIGKIFTARFEKWGVPLSVLTTGSYFDSIEIIVMISLLKIIDNPRQDVHLLAVLHSPVYDLSADDLIKIKSRAGGKSFYDCLKFCLDDPRGFEYDKKIQKFHGDMRRWKKLSKSEPVSLFLSRLYDESNYLNYAGAMPDGQRRQGRLRALLNRAVVYENTVYKGFGHFIEYIEKLQNTGAEIDENLPYDSGDTVKMMTIHLSKGLEFPIVIICRAGKKFNTDDIRSSLALHSDYGFGPFHVNPERRVKCNTLARLAVSCACQSENISERMRVLYVAMTRAKEKLIITGSVADLAKSNEKFSRYADDRGNKLPLHYIIKAGGFLDWITPAALRVKNDSLIKIKYYTYSEAAEIITSGDEPINRENPAVLDYKESDAVNEAREEIHKKLSWRYFYARETVLPQKVSISEIKRTIYLEQAKDSEAVGQDHAPDYPLPDFMRKIVGVSASDIGRATHTLMQKIDLYAEATREILIEMTAELVRIGLIPEDVAPSIPFDKIVNFTRSGLAARIRKSGFVKRESPFVLQLKSDEVYPNDPGAAREKILLHGIIDLYFMENGGYVIVDYKSESVKRGVEAIKEKYALQLEMYRRAVEETTGGRVIETLLYLFDADGYVEINPDTYSIFR